MTTRKRFNQTAILKSLDAKCKRCGASAKRNDLTIHHKDHNSSNVDWKNIAIYCRECHNIVEGTNTKKSKMR